MLLTAVELSDQQIHFSFFGNTAQKSKTLAVRRKAGAGVEPRTGILNKKPNSGLSLLEPA